MDRQIFNLEIEKLQEYFGRNLNQNQGSIYFNKLQHIPNAAFSFICEKLIDCSAPNDKFPSVEKFLSFKFFQSEIKMPSYCGQKGCSNGLVKMIDKRTSHTFVGLCPNPNCKAGSDKRNSSNNYIGEIPKKIVGVITYHDYLNDEFNALPQEKKDKINSWIKAKMEGKQKKGVSDLAKNMYQDNKNQKSGVSN